MLKKRPRAPYCTSLRYYACSNARSCVNMLLNQEYRMEVRRVSAARGHPRRLALQQRATAAATAAERPRRGTASSGLNGRGENRRKSIGKARVSEGQSLVRIGVLWFGEGWRAPSPVGERQRGEHRRATKRARYTGYFGLRPAAPRARHPPLSLAPRPKGRVPPPKPSCNQGRPRHPWRDRP